MPECAVSNTKIDRHVVLASAGLSMLGKLSLGAVTIGQTKMI